MTFRKWMKEERGQNPALEYKVRRPGRGQLRVLFIRFASSRGAWRKHRVAYIGETGEVSWSC